MSFPEEPLDSSIGYYPAEINQKICKINNGYWTIVRKLGWGPRSSTWLAINYWGTDYAAVKIFTASATRDLSAANEQKLLYLVEDVPTGEMTQIRDNFYEESSWGDHLCLLMNLFNPESVERLRLSNTEKGQYLPLYMVQKIAADILWSLFHLEARGIIHGAVLPDNFLFWTAQAACDIRPDLERWPCSSMVSIIGRDGKKYRTVRSQPLRPHYYKWDDKIESFAWGSICLSNFSYAHRIGERALLSSPPAYLPPEVLLRGDIDCSADIWMLACSAYLLATGTPLFSESYVASPLKIAQETIPKLENLLKKNGKVRNLDIPVFAAFLRLCLVIDPDKRATATELLFENDWVEEGIIT